MSASNNVPDFSKKLVKKNIFGCEIQFLNFFKVTFYEYMQILFTTVYITVFYFFMIQSPAFILFFTNWAPRLRYVYILYLCWVFYDRRTPYEDGRKCLWFKNLFIFRLYNDYFPIKLVKTADLMPDKNYLLVMYPHGIVPFSVVTNFGSYTNNVDKLYPGIDFGYVTVNFAVKAPLIREYFLNLGARSPDESSILYFLNRKPSKGLLIMPEGANASLYSRPGSDYFIRKNQRKGFIRVALKTGTSLVPVFSFGENNSLDMISKFTGWIRHLSDGIYKMTRIRIVIVKGAGIFQQSFGLLPRKVAITTVVGKPIPVPKVESPSEELVNEYLEKFFTALKDLFEENKHMYDLAGSKASLKFI